MAEEEEEMVVVVQMKDCGMINQPSAACARLLGCCSAALGLGH